MCGDFLEITDDAEGHRAVTFQEAVAAIGSIVAPGRRSELKIQAPHPANPGSWRWRRRWSLS